MLAARVAPPLPDGELPQQVQFGAPSAQHVIELVAGPGRLLVRRLAADLMGLGYAVAWIRPMPFEVDANSLAPLVVMALTAAHQASSGENEPAVVVVETPTAAQAEAVLDQVLMPGVPEPFGPSVMLIVDSRQSHRPRLAQMARVRVDVPPLPGREVSAAVTRAVVQRGLDGASAAQLAALEMAGHLGYAHPRFGSLEPAVAESARQPWWVPLSGDWWQVEPAWRSSLTACAAKTPGMSRSACLSRLVAELAEAGAIHEGIELCLNAGWPGMAADLLAGEAETFLSSGRHVALTYWLERLPPDVARSHPGLARVAAALIPVDASTAGWDVQAKLCGPGPEDASPPGLAAAPRKHRWGLHRSRRSPVSPGTTASDQVIDAVPGPVATDATHVAVQSTDRNALVRVEARLLGQFELLVKGQSVPSWRGNRGRMLLAFLLLHRTRPLTRDELGGAFWPDAAPEVVRNRLHVALYGLRRDLRALSDHPIVVHGQRGFSLHPRIDLWLDAEAFDEALCAARKEPPDNQDGTLTWYEEALQLYRGELLEDAPFEEWALLPRERLRLKYLDALDQVARLRFAAGRYTDCLDACERLIPGDLCREEVHRLMMRCYTRLNQPHLAVRQYHQCERQLRDELEIEPAEATRQLFERIRRRELV